MDAQTIVISVSFGMSLVFGYLPILKDWYDKQTPTFRGGIMIGVIFIATVISFSLSCLEVETYMTCDKFGAYDSVKLFILSLAANQSAYLTLVKPNKK